MPFTLSHPAAVLPLRGLLRGRLPFAALVAGSVSPDLPYYLTPGNFPYLMHNAHTLPRAFTYCLPAGLLLLLILRALQPAARHLLPAGPAALSERWLRLPFLSPGTLPFTLLAILLGALTHIAWDDLTHATGHSVRALAFLRTEVAWGFELFRVLQHVSTLLGATLLYLFLRAECGRAGLPLRWRMHRLWLVWGAALAAALAFTALTFTTDWNYALTANDRRLGFLFVISLVRNFFAFLIFAALAKAALTAKK